MMGKTHIAIGIATAFAIMQPKTTQEYIISTVGGSIGGVMADIDVKIDTSNKFAARASLDALYGEILAISISITALASNYFTGGTILQEITDCFPKSIIGLALFIALTIIGELSKHRDKTHSLAAWAIFSISVFLIEPKIGIAFTIGYGSHLLLNLFNKSPIRLFYPLKKGFCFKLCYANRLGNEMILVIGVVVIIAYILLHSLFVFQI